MRDDEAAYWKKILGFVPRFAPRERWSSYDHHGAGPRGIPLRELDWPLRRSEGDIESPPVADAAKRFTEAFPRYLPHFGRGPSESLDAWWDGPRGWREAPYEALLRVFTPDEVTRLWWGSILTSSVDDAFVWYDPRGLVVHRVRNSMWRYGWRQDYNLLVSYYEKLGRFRFGDGFTVTLDHATKWNEWGTATYDRGMFLDGVFGYVVHHRNIPVLTVGFSLSAQGVLVRQVQLREPRGNKWLFKLPKPYLEYALDRMAEAFGDTPLWLTEGASTVLRIRETYGSDAPKFDAKGCSDRIKRFYDRPLDGYERGEGVTACGVRFRRLTSAPISRAA